MRAAVTVVGPIPSPRKKMTFFAAPAACAACAERPSMAAAIIMRVVLMGGVPGWLEADGDTDEGEDRGVVHHAGELVRAEPHRADEDVGSAVRLTAGGHRDGRLL